MIVVFNPTEFKTDFPQYAKISDSQLTFFFNTACQFLDNTNNSLVEDGDERKLFLYYLVAHLAELSNRGGGMVGSIGSVSEGGVSTSVTGIGRDQNWYTQTQWGALFWTATYKYRQGIRYITE